MTYADLSPLIGDMDATLLRDCGVPLRELAGMEPDGIRQRTGVGAASAKRIKAAFAIATMAMQEAPPEPPLLDSPEGVAQVMRPMFLGRPTECIYAIYLNVRRRLIGRPVKIADGLLDQILIHPREVYRGAIVANAHTVILSHNHPSGDSSPSEPDIRVTRDLIRAGQCLKIELVDHVIMGAPSAERPRDYTSLRELGYFYGH